MVTRWLGVSQISIYLGIVVLHSFTMGKTYYNNFTGVGTIEHTAQTKTKAKDYNIVMGI